MVLRNGKLVRGFRWLLLSLFLVLAGGITVGAQTQASDDNLALRVIYCGALYGHLEPCG